MRTEPERFARRMALSNIPSINQHARWAAVVDLFLPVRTGDSLWRFSRRMYDEEPDQGWKIHVSATVLNAPDMLQACAPYLTARDVLFKACADLDVLERLNTGIFYGFSQVGKVLTVYPRSAAQAKAIAADLHELTKQFQGPRVPYDLPYEPGSCVHYRYGGFRKLEVIFPDGSRNTAIRDPSGKYWTDRREPGGAVPDWLLNPFKLFEGTVETSSPLCTRFLTYESLSQRGKGGTYLCVDIQSVPARKCVLKEGRRHGEVCRDGRDGYDFVIAEERALRRLNAANAAVPEVIDSFAVESNRYLAMAHIEGENLMSLCSYPRKRLPIAVANVLASKIASLLADIHSAGVVWRDCKPLNLMVSADGRVFALDFEGAASIDEPSSLAWGTPGYTPPELKDGPITGSNLPEDLFALGATLHQLYSSIVPVTQDSSGGRQALPRKPISRVRKGLHPLTCKYIDALLDPDPRKRPPAREVAAELASTCGDDSIAIDGALYKRRRKPRARRKEGAEEVPGANDVVVHVPAPPKAAKSPFVLDVRGPGACHLH